VRMVVPDLERVVQITAVLSNVATFIAPPFVGYQAFLARAQLQETASSKLLSERMQECVEQIRIGSELGKKVDSSKDLDRWMDSFPSSGVTSIDQLAAFLDETEVERANLMTSLELSRTFGPLDSRREELLNSLKYLESAQLQIKEQWVASNNFERVNLSISYLGASREIALFTCRESVKGIN